jgi:hypothetical protein
MEMPEVTVDAAQVAAIGDIYLDVDRRNELALL